MSAARGALPEPPEGFELLPAGEAVRASDLIWRPFSAKWSPVRESSGISEIGMDSSVFYAAARAIPKEAGDELQATSAVHS